MKLYTRIERLTVLCDDNDARGEVSQEETAELDNLARRLRTAKGMDLGGTLQFLDFALHPRIYTIIDREVKRRGGDRAVEWLEQRTLRAMRESSYNYPADLREWLNNWVG